VEQGAASPMTQFPVKGSCRTPQPEVPKN